MTLLHQLLERVTAVLYSYFFYHSDLLQDVVGSKGLLNHTSAYPNLTAEVQSYGISWPGLTFSTHPPTAFMFLIPFLPLQWPTLALAWAGTMVLCILVAAYAYGLSKRSIVIASPLLLWPPMFTSLAQLTPIWLLGLALAWRFRERSGGAGACVALASLPKIVAALALAPWLLARQWRSLSAFVGIWLTAVLLLAVLDISAIPDYLRTNYFQDGGSVALGNTSGSRNGALIPFSAHLLWPLGILAAVFVCLIALLAARHGQGELRAWMMWSWCTVALLPIAWTYSLLPLLPAVMYGLVRGSRLARALSVVAMAAPFAAPWPSQNPTVVAITIASSGLALGIDGARGILGSEFNRFAAPLRSSFSRS